MGTALTRFGGDMSRTKRGRTINALREYLARILHLSLPVVELPNWNGLCWGNSARVKNRHAGSPTC